LSTAATVLMPVYNGEAYLKEAIESILSQTFSDFEFLIINDASTDKTVEIISSYNDPRIRLINNDENLQIAKSLNLGIKLSKAEFIIRMDCDDIAMPYRLEKQVKFMNDNPDIGVCGGFLNMFGIHSFIGQYPQHPQVIKCGMLYGCNISHPSVILRKSLFIKHNLFYDPEYLAAEDYELWSRAIKYMNFTNLEDVLLKYRTHTEGMSAKYSEIQMQNSIKIRRNQLIALGINPTQQELELHELIAQKIIYPGLANLSHCEILSKLNEWINKIMRANNVSMIYDEQVLSYILNNLEQRVKKYFNNNSKLSQ